MDRILPVVIFYILTLQLLLAQESNFTYEPSISNPYGLPNPNAPEEIRVWSDLIGECECKSITRNKDAIWADTVNMRWTFKYIMNGFGIQDETLKEDGKHSGSIRQFIPDSSRWFVHYYSLNSPSPSLSTWEGNKNDSGNIVLYNEQKAPNGMDGFYKITFSEISKSGFNWLGEWVDKSESFSYPTWKIYCKKREI